MMRNIHEREAQQTLRTGQRILIVSMTFTRDRQSDKRRYNAPTSNEIAMVFVNDDGEPPFERDIRIYPVNPLNPNQPFINLHILSPNMDPMTYPILFPYGEPGWQTNWQCESYPGAQANKVRHNVSMLQYKVALTAIRDIYSPILAAGKLSQQWIVDSYLQVEANNLNYVRQNQKRLRVEQYKGLADYMSNIAQNANVQAGVAIILPSSFEGSPRNMRERCCDAMSIFSKHGAPDLFVTFTANPTWTEIVSNLRDGEQTSDRPDLVARVFKIKLDALIEVLKKNGLLGQCLAFVYTIEFQKRGLPHAHILLTLRAEDKFTTSERIDQVVSAEIPPAVDSRLREVILRCMMHGPCGAANGNAACMVDGKCSKQYPKVFQPVTKRNDNGYPEYRRVSGVQVEVRRSTMDNRNVVPYNPFISLKYNAHVNVEVVTSLKAVKYIYKYIFKGHDYTNIVITSDGQAQLNHNEITNYVDGRYVSAPEAMWRLREFHMHDRSHTVMRLPVHLLNQHTVVFQEGNEEQALALAETGKTKLTQWFELNQQNTDAHHLLYTDLPNHYVYVKGSWKKRQRGGDNIVSRMYMVNMKDEERFFLRIILLHVQGATGFEMLRTYNDETYETFKGAAAARGLLATDEEWDRCLRDGSTYKMPKQLREMLSYICCFCHPSKPLKLWEEHIDDFILDYIRFDAADVAKNKALHDIEAILKQHGMSCSTFGLPEPTGNAPSIVTYDQAVEEEEGFRRPHSN